MVAPLVRYWGGLRRYALMSAQAFALDVEIQAHRDCRPLISSLATASPLVQKSLELSITNIRPCRCPKDQFTDLGVRRDFIVSR
jgi:hypothetical protein